MPLYLRRAAGACFKILALSLSVAWLGCSHAATAKAIAPLAQYEQQARQFQPLNGLAATNSNDIRQFIYEWFTHFEHASSVDYFLAHLDDQHLSAVFPGMAPMTSHAAFADWYNNLLAQTLWNFHDVSAIEIKQTAAQSYHVSFVVDWYGEVRADSAQLAGWQSRSDSRIYHRKLRQDWTVRTGGPLVIEQLTVSVAP